MDYWKQEGDMGNKFRTKNGNIQWNVPKYVTSWDDRI
jgi:hypothetical protein